MRKLYLKIISNYRYLAQLVITCFIFLLIPCVVVLYFNMYRSFEKLQEETHTFYLSATQNFADYFLEEIESAVTLTNQVGIYSRIQGNGMNAEVHTNALQVERLESSPYYFRAATDSLAYYRNNVNDTLEGIYYPEQDWLITSAHKFTACEYVRDSLQIKDEKEQDGVIEFLKNNEAEKIEMYALYPREGQAEEMLLAVETNIGQTKTPVKMLFRYDEASFQKGFLTSARFPGLQFGILDRQNKSLLFTAGADHVDLRSDGSKDLLAAAGNDSIFPLKQDGTEYMGFVTYNSFMKLYYCIIGSQDDIYQSSLTWFRNMQFISFSMVLVLLCLLAIMIYINYKPIYQLSCKISVQTQEGEFANISRVIDSMTDELNERNLLLKDYLLENILSGRSISQGLAKCLHIAEHTGDFRIYVIEGISLNTQNRGTLVNELLHQFSVPAFITDILEEEISLIFCMVPTGDGTGTTAYLRRWFEHNYPEAVLSEGVVVSSINDVRESYQSCRREKKSSGSTEKTALLAAEILQFLQENFSNPDINQTMVADQFQISSYTLSRMFKKQFGIGFMECLSNIRIESAKQLLLTTELSVGEIAARVGLPNLNYFSRFFRNTVGVSPTKYRTNPMQ